MSNDKITGWVAWHPDHGANFNSINDISWETAMLIHVDSEQGGEDYGFDLPLESWERAKTFGWQIRPVEIRFTDEEKITFANGATVELVGDGEEAFVGIDWEKKKDEEEKQDER